MKRIQMLGLLGALAACGDANSGPPMLPGGGGTPAANQVFMQNTAFTPVSRNVAAGVTVQWVNQDGITHTVTSSTVPVGAVAFNAGNVAGSGTFSATLTVPGTYEYFCSIHGTATTGMHATVVVN